ncbi:unnamed protein product [Coccothraustes coccothraustes]
MLECVLISQQCMWAAAHSGEPWRLLTVLVSQSPKVSPSFHKGGAKVIVIDLANYCYSSVKLIYVSSELILPPKYKLLTVYFPNLSVTCSELMCFFTLAEEKVFLTAVCAM